MLFRRPLSRLPCLGAVLLAAVLCVSCNDLLGLDSGGGISLFAPSGLTVDDVLATTEVHWKVIKGNTNCSSGPGCDIISSGNRAGGEVTLLSDTEYFFRADIGSGWDANGSVGFYSQSAQLIFQFVGQAGELNFITPSAGLGGEYIFIRYHNYEANARIGVTIG